jgi:hypothetical protein
MATATTAMAIVAGLGVGAAIWFSERGLGSGEAYALRVTNGVTETGELVTTTTPSGQVKTLIKWRTRTGKTEFTTDTVRLAGSTVFGAGDRVTLPGGAVTVLGPGETIRQTRTQFEVVTQPVTETQHQTVTEVRENTVTETQTVTETVVQTTTVIDTVTEIITITELLPAPTP